MVVFESHTTSSHHKLPTWEGEHRRGLWITLWGKEEGSGLARSYICGPMPCLSPITSEGWFEHSERDTSFVIKVKLFVK